LSIFISVIVFFVIAVAYLFQAIVQKDFTKIQLDNHFVCLAHREQ